jgi:spermidine/putrescine-binding protein
MSIFSEKITRQRFLQGMALAAGSAALAGCGGGSGAGSKEVTFMNWEQTEGTPLGDALKAFEKKTGIAGAGGGRLRHQGAHGAVRRHPAGRLPDKR